jgi:hypothetical protein
MPTFTNPTSDANSASEALRGLAHATRTFQEPADTYRVIGDLLGGVRSLRQVLDQLASVHDSHSDRVTDDARDYAAGATAATSAADELRQAAALVDQAEDRLNTAMIHSGRIVWSPGDRLVERWIGVVFLQGDDADFMLELIDTQGWGKGIENLAAWDYGTETTDAAMANGDVHDTAPVYQGDRQAESGEYVMTYNAEAGHVALYRRHLIPAEDAIDPPGEATEQPAAGIEARRSAIRAGGWFEPAAISEVKQARGLAL